MPDVTGDTMNTPMDKPRKPLVLVTGGTGTLGRFVIPRLQAAGHPVRVLSRKALAGGDGIEYATSDLSTGEGLEAAVVGADVIVHCAGTRKGDGDKTRHLVRAASRAEVRHLVYISVVGADTIPVVSAVDRAMFGYFACKLDAERVISESGIPWTTLRATQFYDSFLLVVRGMAKLPVIPIPTGARFQPVDTGEVAARLVELALAPPAGLVADIGGPRAYPMGDLLKAYLRASHKHRALVPMRVPGKAARAVRAGANLTPEHAVGKRTWEEFLVERVR
jgi:uncharacterized protein YbjT (DUF2867 family)